MAHFAELDKDNIVTRVIVIPDEHEADGEAWCNALLGGTWKQTSYNTFGNVHSKGGTPLRKNYAGIGYKYDEVRDAFIPPTPFPSWILNEEKGQWYTSVAQKQQDWDKGWNEETQKWDKI